MNSLGVWWNGTKTIYFTGNVMFMKQAYMESKIPRLYDMMNSNGIVAYFFCFQ